MSSHLRYSVLGLLLALLGAVCIVPQLAGETVLHNFVPPPKGSVPDGGVIRDSAGNLYGTTLNGGSAGGGVVFKVTPSGHQTILHNFTGRADGGLPFAGVIRDAAGNLYGTTSAGGSADWGTVYRIDAAGNETVLYSFQGGADGGLPYGGVVRDSAGNLYGTTQYGGNVSACGGNGCGVVYKLDPSGHETVLYTFTGGADGANPYAGVIRDSAGNLYGTTGFGGSADWGTVYKIDVSGHQTVLYSFTDGADGGWPLAGVIRDSAGNLYGTTFAGGVVYKVDKAGHETVLYGFTGGTDGRAPASPVIRDKAGNLYGTTLYGGAANSGVVYKLDPDGNETVLYSFNGNPDGSGPRGSIVRDSKGNIYGAS